MVLDVKCLEIEDLADFFGGAVEVGDAGFVLAKNHHQGVPLRNQFLILDQMEHRAKNDLVHMHVQKITFEQQILAPENHR